MDVPPVERRLVLTPEGYVHLRTTPGDGPDLLLLHQVPASGRLWLPVMRSLAPLPCVAPDMLNLGESDATSRPLSLAEHAGLLWDAVQEARPGPKVVVGHHTGAALAAVMAAEHPGDVVGLGLVGYPAYFDWRTKLSKYERLNPVPATPEGVADVWRFMARAFTEDADPDLVFDAFADRVQAGRVWYEGYVALWNADLRAVLAGARSPGRPTSVIAPDADALSALADEVGHILDAPVTRIPGGTFVLTEDPAALAAVLRDLWRSL
ncbi:alpha/beta fold hydrolase [Actinomadura sp. 1N219]|uniref:alpha/beta fold hydrolase n=1 Tax=Actinomadura sp. 1N219 TaxID=3375152 RepID=UPI0037AFD10D